MLALLRFADPNDHGVAVATTTTGRALVALVAVVGVLVTGLVFGSEAIDAREDAQSRVQQAAERTAADIHALMSAELAVLTAVRNDLLMEWPVSRPRFHDVADAAYTAELFSATSAIEIIRYVQANDLEAYVAQVNDDPSLATLGYPSFEVDDAGRPWALIIDYVAPIDGNEPAFGLDVGTVPGRTDVSFRARDSGRASATRPIELVQGGRGVLVDVPLYATGDVPETLDARREEFVGVLASVVRLDDLLAPALASEPDAVIALDDVEDGQRRPLLSVDRTDPFNSRTTTATVEVADRTWQVRAHPAAGWAVVSPSTLLILVAGLASTALLTLAVAAADRARVRAVAAAGVAQAARVQLAGFNAQLEDRIRSRTAELASSNADLEQFAALAGHDLQQPLRQVSRSVDRLTERYGDQLDDRGRQHLGFVADGTSRMRMMLEGLLAYSRIGPGRPTIQPLRLADVVDTVAIGLRDAIADSDATVDCRSDAVVHTDPEHLTEILRGVITNAVTHGHGNSAPVVMVGAVRDVWGWTISVTDNGPGIPEAHHERAFELFEQLGSRATNGAGVGLSIVRRRVELLGGRIWIENDVGGGTRVVFTVPAPDAIGSSD